MSEQGPNDSWGTPPQGGSPQGSSGASAWSDPHAGQPPAGQAQWQHLSQPGPPSDQRWSASQPQWHPAGDPNTNTPARSLAGLRPILQLVVPVLVVVALLLTENGAETNAFEEVTAWSIFAVVMALLSLAPLVGGGLGLDKSTAWSVGAVGTAGLVGYWVIIVLPGVSSNAGFMLTLATACAVIGCWLSPGRRV